MPKTGQCFRTILEELGHPQPATPLQTNNICIAIKQCRSKLIDMRFYWVKDHIKKESSWFIGGKEVKMMPIILLSIILRAIIASCVPDSCPVVSPVMPPVSGEGVLMSTKQAGIYSAGQPRTSSDPPTRFTHSDVVRARAPL
jgi:hypothetical protein